jgi:tetratricopeptide (TPR) repeat protein
MSPKQLLERADRAWNDGLDELARRYYKESVIHFRGEMISDPESLAHGLSMLAQLSRIDGDYTEAQVFYSESVEVLERGLGEDHPSTIFHISLHANCLLESNRLEDAEKVARLGLLRAERALGPYHRYLGDSLMNLADILWQKKNAEEAELYLRAAIAHDKTLAGSNSAFYAAGLLTLAGWLEVGLRVKEAFATIVEVQKISASTDVLGEEGKDELRRRYGSIKEKFRSLH